MSAPQIPLDSPPVTVIVPVRNAARTLTHCVRALRAQDYPGEQYELVFIDNRSTDGSRRILEGHDDAIRIIDEPRRGASAARNAGIAAARFELLAFTDADCVPSPDWLRRLVAHATARPSADFVGGAIAAYQPRSPVARYAERLLDQRSSIEQENPPYAITANLLARAAMLRCIGGFDVAGLRGQDVDLSFRAFLDEGARFSYAAEAVVEHFNVETVGALFRKGIQHGRAAGFLYRKYAHRLGYRPWRACVHPARYGRIVDGFVTSARAAARCARRATPWPDEDVRYPFYSAVFATGKQVGLLLENLSRCWGPQPARAGRTRGSLPADDSRR